MKISAYPRLPTSPAQPSSQPTSMPLVCTPHFPFAGVSCTAGRICRTLQFKFSRARTCRSRHSTRRLLASRRFSPSKPTYIIRKMLAVFSGKPAMYQSGDGSVAKPEWGVDTVSDDWKVPGQSSFSNSGETKTEEQAASEEFVRPALERKIREHFPDLDNEDDTSGGSNDQTLLYDNLSTGFRPLSPPPLYYKRRLCSMAVDPRESPDEALCTVHQCSLPCGTCENANAAEPLRFAF